MMLDELHKTCRRLLEEGQVQVVIGYGPSPFAGPSGADGAAIPMFVTRPEDVARLAWNDRCFANLAAYLTRKEIRNLGKAAICVKGCDERALVVLEKESQIDRSQLVVIGLACDGVGQPRSAKCAACEVRTPRRADVIVGKPSEAAAPDAKSRYAALEEFLAKPVEERMAFWREEFSRCVKCYACRQVCPMCYCQRCIADKNRPRVISSSPTLEGSFAWHISRAFHLAGRCVGCEECSRACPAGIDLRLLNLSLAKAGEEGFGFLAGMDPEAEPIVGSYSRGDREEFIR
jgi:formate dehydrogenase (coenzyme F420) beta subunit